MTNKFTVRPEGKPTPEHQTLRVFANGASAGLLTMRRDEAREFESRIMAGNPGHIPQSGKEFNRED